MSIIVWATGIVTAIIQALWYPGIIILMALESACIPIPSEIIMPFAGFLAYQGQGFDILWITVAGTVGNLIGSLVAYYAGLKLGRPLILKYGRYVLIRKKHVDMADRWFCKYGEWTTFFSRMLPVIRTFISLPAGMARMDLKKFILFTTLGSIPWNLALTLAGYELGANWASLTGVFEALDIVIIAAVIIVAIIIAWMYLRNGGEDEREEKCEPLKPHSEE